MEDFKTMLAAARAYGERVGRNAAGWLIHDLWGGRRSRPAAALRMARAVVDDSAECAERYGWQVPDLSGEWADGPTSDDVASECGLELAEDADDAARDEYHETLNELCSAWEDSVADALFGALEESARSFLASEVAPR